MERIEIDIVYTFCTGDDPEHLKQRNLYRQPSIADSSRQCRYRSNGEIYASIASALTFAPWIRTIFVIVADGQEELFEKGWPIFFDGQQYPFPVNRITVVPHSVIYAEAKLLEHLPTFNSQSIECHLHRIPGLENHFLYSNDDTFFGDHVTPATFYTAPNKPKVCYSKTLMPHPGARDKMNKESWYWSRVNNVNLLNRLMSTGAVKSDLPANHILLRNSSQQRFRQRYMLIHQIKPLTKQIYEDAWKNSILQPWLIQTSASRFRSLNDIEPVGLLLEWKSDCNQTARCKLRSSTLSIDDYNSLDKLFDKIEQGHYALYCINDNMIIANPGRIARFKQGLQTRLPHCRITTA